VGELGHIDPNQGMLQEDQEKASLKIGSKTKINH
jgi:hypothetical protein